MRFEGICGLKTELNYPFKRRWYTLLNLQESKYDQGFGHTLKL